MGKSNSTQGGGGSEMRAAEQKPAEPPSDAERTERRLIVWEVNIAKGCLDSFNKMLTAHGIVLSLLVTANLMGFLQPPRGWDSITGHMFSNPLALTTFALCNSLSLYTAASGLLFYIYCSLATIVSLHSVPLPSHFGDALSLDVLHKFRAALRRVAIPAVKRRCAFLFFFMAFSLTFCMIAYISGGIASTEPGSSVCLVGVILPAVPGCLVLLFLFYIVAIKLRLELDFDIRCDKLWSILAPDDVKQPKICTLKEETIQALDPIPHLLSWFLRFPTKFCRQIRSAEK